MLLCNNTAIPGASSVTKILKLSLRLQITSLLAEWVGQCRNKTH